jgi:Bacteriophage Mu Gam like protein.
MNTEPMEQENEKVPNRITSLEEAARYAYGLAETRKEIEDLEKIAESEIEFWREKIREVESWRDEITKPLREKVNYFEALLSDFHYRQYMEAPNEKAQAKLKTIKLPYGITLKSTSRPTVIKPVDEEAYKSYMKECGWVEYSPTFKWAELKKRLHVNEEGLVFGPDGTLLEFLVVEPQERRFEVK